VPRDWTSYDSAASTHDRLGVPAMFERPARELAARMDFATARATLDVGTGSGIVASQAVGVCPLVVAVDPSVEMVKTARRNAVGNVAACAAPGLPFGDGAFDRVTSGFVLSHIPDYRAALADMVRVVERGGLVGATAWGSLRTAYRDLWDAIVERFVEPAEMKMASAQFIPWEEWLGEPAHLREALESAGLVDVAVDEVECPVHITIDEFLAIRENSGAARFLRTVVDEDAWERFRAACQEEFHARFRDPIDHVRVAFVGVGRR
jgi:ubiquinone/menaquinone biosynthesis C-methylase UbiE